MAVWIALKDGKVREQVLCDDDVDPSFCEHPKGTEYVQVARVGDLAAELFDPETQSWVPNPDHAAFEIDFNLGPEHRAKAHMQKVMEAKLMQAGVVVDGLIKKESELTGVTVEDLAAKILEHNDAFEAEELNRRAIKTGTAIESSAE